MRPASCGLVTFILYIVCCPRRSQVPHACLILKTVSFCVYAICMLFFYSPFQQRSQAPEWFSLCKIRAWVSEFCVTVNNLHIKAAFCWLNAFHSSYCFVLVTPFGEAFQGPASQFAMTLGVWLAREGALWKAYFEMLTSDSLAIVLLTALELGTESFMRFASCKAPLFLWTSLLSEARDPPSHPICSLSAYQIFFQRFFFLENALSYHFAL